MSPSVRRCMRLFMRQGLRQSEADQGAMGMVGAASSGAELDA